MSFLSEVKQFIQKWEAEIERSKQHDEELLESLQILNTRIESAELSKDIAKLEFEKICRKGGILDMLFCDRTISNGRIVPLVVELPTVQMLKTFLYTDYSKDLLQLSSSAARYVKA